MAFINYLIHLAIMVGLYILGAVSLNFAVGFTGLLNLGQIGFFGIGAYTSALLTLAGVPIWISIICGIILAGLAGILLSLPTKRLKGDYLALATLGFTFILATVARNWTSVTHGALGVPGIPKVVPNNAVFLLIVTIIVIATIFFFKWLAKSQFGKRCEAVRDDELAAKSLGIDTFMHKLGAMGISACFAGLMGALFAHYITYIDPAIFNLEELILLVSMVIVGGLASVRGAVLGATILFLLPEPLRFIGFPSTILGPMRVMIFAAVLLLILIYRPRGIFGKVDLA